MQYITDTVGLLEIRCRHFVPEAVFFIDTPSRGRVFLSAAATPYCNDARLVVLVDAQRFVALWRQEPYSIHTEFSHGTPESWRRDRKYADAERGFAEGVNNPVPLADVVCCAGEASDVTWRRRWLLFRDVESVTTRTFDYVAFNNGITRTIWLLSHGVTAFPVKCDVKMAARLHQAAGISQWPARTIAELLGISATLYDLPESAQQPVI